MERTDFKVEDFIMDESFQQYCLGTNKDAVDFWTNWILANPSKYKEVNTAKKLCFVLAGNHNAESFTKDEIAFHSLLLSKGINPFSDNKKGLHKVAEENLQQGSHNNIQPIKRISTFRKIAVAASLIFLLGIGAYFISNKIKNGADDNLGVLKVSKNDVKPGSNKAILTLANGKTINLSDTSIGELAKQSGITITKTDNGQILFSINKDAAQNESKTVQFNTIATPMGGQYQIELADGTKVWLNAASSLKFPTSFANLQERKVELSGEGYFEVKHDAKQPFRVATATQMVEDIGTAFNINSYADENFTATTLLEGSAKIITSTQNIATGKKNEVVLIPNQQAYLNTNGNLKVSKVDIEESIAWKNGEFMFNDEPLESILKKVARWYNVDIKYDDEEISQKTFGGTISRFGNLSEVLRILELTKEVHFKITGREVTVSN